MALISTNFVAGKMNKSVDERLIPDGQYIDAMNVRLGSTETTEIGAVENSRGNSQLTNVSGLGGNPRCIGAYDDGISETMYWFVTSDTTDMILSYHTPTQVTTKHVVSLTVLNFNPTYLITGVSLIEDLLFFTDDFNPPRKINVTRNYSEPSGVPLADNIVPEDLNVILKPPGYEPLDNLPAPEVNLLNIPGEENYLEDRFISFGYRYRYQDKEYSATSLFTRPAFQPGTFSLDPNNYKNRGMVNNFNSANVTFDTGSSRVIEIDVLYKLTTSTTIYVIERFVKTDLGWGDNTDQTILFTNSKIYTTLGSDELLRLYDNVPRFSKAQTIMANRLVYGNNVDGYDIATSSGQILSQNYITSLKSQSINLTTGPAPTFNSGVSGQGNSQNYSINPNSVGYNYANNTATFDLTDFVANSGTGIPNKLLQGTQLNFTFSVESHAWQSTSTDAAGSVTTTCTAAGVPIADCSCYPTWNGTDSPFDISFTFRLNQDYTSVFDMVNSSEFQAQVGTALPLNITALSQCGSSTQGTSMCDNFNCSVAIPTICAYTKYNSSINDQTSQQGFNLTTTPGSNEFSLQLIAMNSRYVDGGGVTHNVYEYFRFVNATFFYISDQDTASLHSNRDYETGIVYLDDYGRASTVLVSLFNTIFVPPAQSIDKNEIQVQIPVIDQAPYWANSYKFVVKPSSTTYETIYVNFFYVDPETNVTYFKLEGDNINKVSTGQTLIVKKDSEGPVTTEIKATVLETGAQTRNFLNADPTNPSPATNLQLPGFYMQLKATNFTASAQAGDIIETWPSQKAQQIDGFAPTCSNGRNPVGTFLKSTTANFIAAKYCYRLAAFDDPLNPNYANMTNISIPSGSVIQMRIVNKRRERGSLCEGLKYVYDKQYVASQDYATFKAWWFGDNIAIDTGDIISGNLSNTFLTNTVTSATSPPCLSDITDATGFGEAIYQFLTDPNGTEYLTIATGIPACAGSIFANKRDSESKVELTIFRADNTIIFETEPADADPDLFYDSSEKYPVVHTTQKSYHATGPVKALGTVTSTAANKLIDSSASFIGAVAVGDYVYNRTTANTINTTTVTAIDSGTQLSLSGNIFALANEGYTITRPYENNVNQNNTTEATIILPFANCFTFGNGVESYKIEDALDGRSFSLGERVLAVSNADFKEADRFAGLTYSGLYSGTNNLNNLNEFNLGLANFKDCETSFGPIQYLHARKTDILTLQEDRITYVYAGKNILTDAVGGGLVTSVPEVLGEQIARIEEYGMSFNPESFASFGYDMYFTDTKRGAVIQLSGASAKSDILNVISEDGMRSWFRDQFYAQLLTQKLGGYDPYMSEYVLNSNTIEVPFTAPKVPCNQVLTKTGSNSVYSYVVDAGFVIGQVSIVLTVVSGSVQLTGEWNGNTFPNAGVGPGTYTFLVNKTANTPVDVTITCTPTGTSTYTVQVKCPPVNNITVTQVVVTSAQDVGKYIHAEYLWSNGLVTSPISSQMVTFGSSTTIASLFYSQTGTRSIGVFPYDGVNLTMRSNKINFDDFDFNLINNKFKWLSTNTVYTNTAADVATLLAASASISPITNPQTGLFQATETAASIPLNQSQLYLVYDLRQVTAQKLCYSAASAEEACCDCLSTGDGCTADPACCFGCTAFSASAKRTSQADVCVAPVSANLYHSGAVTYPVIGDLVYTSSICDSNTQAASGFYKVIVENTFIQLDSNGIVINKGFCP